MPGRRLNGLGLVAPRQSRPFRVRARPSDDPLERPDPAAKLVLRGRENHEIGRAPLQHLTAKLLEALSEDFLVPHGVPFASSGSFLRWEGSPKEIRGPRATIRLRPQRTLHAV